MISIFDSINTIGSWFLCGIIFGAGFVAVIIVAVKISDYYSEHHTSKREEKFKKEKILKLGKERNLILIPQELYQRVFYTTGNIKGLQQHLADMRRDYWKKDIIVPYFNIQINPEDDIQSLIKVEGKVLFKGSLYDQEKNTSHQEAEELLIQKLKDFFDSQINDCKKRR